MSSVVCMAADTTAVADTGTTDADTEDWLQKLALLREESEKKQLLIQQTEEYKIFSQAYEEFDQFCIEIENSPVHASWLAIVRQRELTTDKEEYKTLHRNLHKALQDPRKEQKFDKWVERREHTLALLKKVQATPQFKAYLSVMNEIKKLLARQGA